MIEVSFRYSNYVAQSVSARSVEGLLNLSLHIHTITLDLVLRTVFPYLPPSY